jgi:putative endopeptidase
VGQPAYYEKLNTLLKTIPMANWKLYLKANAIEGYATDLSKPLLMPLSIYQSNKRYKKSRGEIMASAVDNYLGEALGQLYVKKYFQKAKKTHVGSS